MFDTVEEAIFDPGVSEKGRTIEFDTPEALVSFRGLFYAARARMARRPEFDADPFLWGGHLVTIRKSRTTLWVGPKNKLALGVKRVR